jgi:hypothetical protein
MMGWIIRILLAVAGIIASWVVAKDEPIFGIAQALVAICLIALLVIIFAIWPPRSHKKPSETTR